MLSHPKRTYPYPSQLLEIQIYGIPAHHKRHVNSIFAIKFYRQESIAKYQVNNSVFKML